MGAAKKQKKKTGSAGGRHGQAGAADAVVAAYGRLVSALGGSGMPSTATEAARAIRSATAVMAKPSGAACFFEVTCYWSAHLLLAVMAHGITGTSCVRIHDRLQLRPTVHAGQYSLRQLAKARPTCHGRLQAKVELLQAAEQLIISPHLASEHAGSEAGAGRLHQHLLRALRCAQDGAEQHNSLLCVVPSFALSRSFQQLRRWLSVAVAAAKFSNHLRL